ncbi:hypothetical protein C8J57DRAFT_1533614 [Mycena rebaudengoi]|nr:hypothetical protein C8J57DRAFT_1533614 [Mycena rebaudengoi]
MFLNLSLVITAVLAMANSAAAANPGGPQTSPQCCNALVPLSAIAVSAVSNILQIELNVIPGAVGVVCRPFVPGSACIGTTLICAAPDLGWGGLIAFNCAQASF